MPTQPDFDAAFWAQVMADASRTIFCSPADAGKVQAAVEARGVGGLITVTPSPSIEPGQLYLSDDGAVERELRRSLRYRPATTCDDPKGTTP